MKRMNEYGNTLDCYVVKAKKSVTKEVYCTVLAVDEDDALDLAQQAFYDDRTDFTDYEDVEVDFLQVVDINEKGTII